MLHRVHGHIRTSIEVTSEDLRCPYLTELVALCMLLEWSTEIISLATDVETRQAKRRRSRSGHSASVCQKMQTSACSVLTAGMITVIAAPALPIAPTLHETLLRTREWWYVMTIVREALRAIKHPRVWLLGGQVAGIACGALALLIGTASLSGSLCARHGWRGRRRGESRHRLEYDSRNHVIVPRKMDTARSLQWAAAISLVRRATGRGAHIHHRPVDIGRGYTKLAHDVICCGVKREYVSIVTLRPVCHIERHRRGVNPDHALGVSF